MNAPSGIVECLTDTSPVVAWSAGKIGGADGKPPSHLFSSILGWHVLPDLAVAMHALYGLPDG